MIISDKSRFDSESFKRELNRIWNVNVQYIVYDKTRKLIVEEFLSYADTDYKFFVFNGKARLCYVASPIGKITGHSSEKRYTYYQLDYSLDANHSWIKLPLTLDNHPTDDVVCPINLQEMIKVAEILASDFPFLRVDLYSDGRQIKVGELTPFPHAGAGVYRPVEYDYLFGNWLTLP
ncbi:hypothetical protein FACS18949_11270 [Clostridia bacterium]|nr:hypothetical protein FACS1894202_06480 [Clostridia bacterium]GHV34710.1 hypothetical protein FACS18949_11270 [Clostridia bacterium]